MIRKNMITHSFRVHVADVSLSTKHLKIKLFFLRQFRRPLIYYFFCYRTQLTKFLCFYKFRNRDSLFSCHFSFRQYCSCPKQIIICPHKRIPLYRNQKLKRKISLLFLYAKNRYRILSILLKAYRKMNQMFSPYIFIQFFACINGILYSIIN